jgi:hypothetical protein
VPLKPKRALEEFMDLFSCQCIAPGLRLCLLEFKERRIDSDVLKPLLGNN